MHTYKLAKMNYSPETTVQAKCIQSELLNADCTPEARVVSFAVKRFAPKFYSDIWTSFSGTATLFFRNLEQSVFNMSLINP